MGNYRGEFKYMESGSLAFMQNWERCPLGADPAWPALTGEPSSGT